MVEIINAHKHEPCLSTDCLKAFVFYMHSKSEFFSLKIVNAFCFKSIKEYFNKKELLFEIISKSFIQYEFHLFVQYLLCQLNI